MPTYTSVALNNWIPTAANPGDVNYPTAYNDFIDLNELNADEVEAARENEQSLLVNLQTNYVNKTLTNNIDGKGLYRFENMKNGEGLNWLNDGNNDGGSQDYLTVAQWEAVAGGGLPDIDALNFNGSFTIPHSQFIVADATDFAVFDYQPDVLLEVSNPSYFYTKGVNKTYILNWTGATPSVVDLDKPIGTTHVEGDRLRFIFLNPKAGDGIIAATSKIQGYTSKITFGGKVQYAGIADNTSVATVLYDTTASFPVSLATGNQAYHVASDQYVNINSRPSSLLLLTDPLSGATWSNAEYVIAEETFSHAIYDLVFTDDPTTGWLLKNVILG